MTFGSDTLILSMTKRGLPVFRLSAKKMTSKQNRQRSKWRKDREIEVEAGDTETVGMEGRKRPELGRRGRTEEARARGEGTLRRTELVGRGRTEGPRARGRGP